MDALERALAVELGGPLVRGVGEGGSVSVLSAFSPAKFAIQQNTADVNLLVIGDSTGNDTTDWVYLFGQWLATTYPTHSVSYRLWNDATPAYDTAVSLGTGSGSNTIRIWNGSVTGAPAFFFTGAKQAAAVAAINPDLIIFNHGKNDAFSDPGTVKGELLSGTEAARLLHPGASIAALLQSPNRDDSTMDVPIAAWRTIATNYGDLSLVDVYSLFVAQGKASSLYADNLHPSAAGTQLFLQAVQQKWNAATTGSGLASAGALLAVDASNLLPNGDFSAFTGAVPDSWTAFSSPTCSKEATIVDGGRAYSLKMVGTTAGARIQCDVPAGSLAALLGNKVTLAVRRYVPSGAASTTGRIAIRYVVGGSTNVTSRAVTQNQGGWCWWIIAGTDIPANATTVSVTLYCDTAANTTSVAYYDRAILVVGDIPRDML